jgi:serine/threonine protein kinase
MNSSNRILTRSLEATLLFALLVPSQAHATWPTNAAVQVPRPLSELAPMAPPALERVVKRCLAKDPEQRWQTARDLLHELEWMREDSASGSAPSWLAAGRSSCPAASECTFPGSFRG